MSRVPFGRTCAMVVTCGLLVAASAAPPSLFDQNLERLGLMPSRERRRLADALDRFDALPADRQRELLEIDARINELSPGSREDHLDALRRYHLWYKNLSPKDQQKIADAPDESAKAVVIDRLRRNAPRPAVIRFGDHDVPIGDLGSTAPIELSNLIRVWLSLNPAQKKQIEAIPARAKQAQELMRIGRQTQIPVHLLLPAEEEALLKRVENSPLYKSLAVQSRLVQSKVEEIAAKKKGGFAAAVAPAVARPLRHLAESIHFQEHPPKSVSPDNLLRFEAVLPSWVRESLEPLPAADARRRLTIIYREIYPPPAEMPLPAKPKTEPAPAPKTEPKKAPAEGKVTPF